MEPTFEQLKSILMPKESIREQLEESMNAVNHPQFKFGVMYGMGQLGKMIAMEYDPEEVLDTLVEMIREQVD